MRHHAWNSQSQNGAECEHHLTSHGEEGVSGRGELRPLYKAEREVANDTFTAKGTAKVSSAEAVFEVAKSGFCM